MRILVYRLGSLGDTVVALPALHLIRRTYPDAHIRLLTNFPVNAKAPAAAAVLGDSGLINSYERYTVGTRSVRELLALWWRLVRFRANVLVYAGPARGIASARRDAHFFRAAGIVKQFGVPVTEAMQQNFFGAPTDAGLAYREPEAARLARNLFALGDARPKAPGSWDLFLTPAEKQAATEALANITTEAFAVSVGTKVQSKDWGAANWAEALARVAAAHPGRALVLLGSPEESPASEQAASRWKASGGADVLNLCGKLSPRESAAVMAHCRLFIGHDSGPMQLAAAVGTPCVAVFAARNIPRVWFPFGEGHQVVYHPVDCMGCGLETCIIERKKCILSITPDEVLAAVTRALTPHPTPV